MESLIKAVLEAGEHVKKGFSEVQDVQYKSAKDLVTRYDVETENILKKLIQPLYPEHTIVAEESSKGNEKPEKAIYIDPIDGTTNFVHSFPFTAISVGVYENDEAVAGVVYNPIMNELYSAEKGSGAWLNDEQISVSSNDDTKKSLVATGFPYSIVERECTNMLTMLGNILKSTRGIRRAGSAALDLCYTAKGVFDCYYEFNLRPWDVAGGICIVREAGGTVTGFDGVPHDITGNFIMASNGVIHGKMLDLIRCP
ncbi:inositol monophosphatase family protein [Limisalsivibrio acetivorans]|uniref:inositol monophosphatase family protein n=1 Tax=Limisalsivibrio acetivorans TaxID=1304888 RepID=UPI00047D9232|nr:inositol monophosphatase family protein [Limisalsivibrio acetivorans]